jgi:hypothetical protein
MQDGRRALLMLRWIRLFQVMRLGKNEKGPCGEEMVRRNRLQTTAHTTRLLLSDTAMHVQHVRYHVQCVVVDLVV